jgi:hypothetical protein
LPATWTLQCDHEGSLAWHRGGGLSAIQGRPQHRLFRVAVAIDQIANQAEQQGSLQVALSGLNSIRHTLDSLSRLAGFDRQGAQVNVAVLTNVQINLQVAERVIEKFDHEPVPIAHRLWHARPTRKAAPLTEARRQGRSLLKRAAIRFNAQSTCLPIISGRRS